MERVYAETVKDAVTGINVKVTINKICNEKYNLYAVPVDSKGTNLIKNPVRRTAASFAEVEKRKLSAVHAAALSVPSGILPTHRKSIEKKESSTINLIVQDLLVKGVNVYPKRSAKVGWSVGVCRATLTYFLNHGFAPFMEKHSDSDDYQTELQAFRAGLIDKAISSGRSSGSRDLVSQSVDAVLKRIEILCDYLNRNYDVPKFSFIEGIVMGKAVPEEQVKSIPDSIFLPFCRLLEELAESEPRMVLGSVLMADGALRTAEAAGTPIWCIALKNNYGVVAVIHQEKDGVRIEKLKSENGYRNVVLSYWGAWLAQKCIDKLGWTDETDELIATAYELSSWVKKKLREICPEFVERVARIEASNPDKDDYGNIIHDVSAYVLRRNAASRWLNYAGLTHDEIDCMLGHKRKEDRLERLFLTDENHQKKIAEKLERYVYNPEHTGNPAFAPVELKSGMNTSIIPYPIIRFKNTNDKPLILRIEVENTEAGEKLQITAPSNSIRNITRRSFHPSKFFDIIGNNLDSFRKEEE